MRSQDGQSEVIEQLFEKLCAEPEYPFPKAGSAPSASRNGGVYVIRSPRGRVVHVGRTTRGSRGLQQRLSNHLHGRSSFTKKYLKNLGSKLRSGYTYQCLEVKRTRQRALLECLAIGRLCPMHLGLSKTAISASRG